MAEDKLEQTTGDENPEEYVAETTGGQQPETVAPKERTRESEIRANIEMWQGLGVSLTEEEVRVAVEALPEVEGFDWVQVIPKGMKMSEVWGKMATRFKVQSDLSVDIDSIRMPRQPDKTYAVAAHFSQEADEETLGKTPKELEKTGKTFMTPLERAVADLRWNTEWATKRPVRRRGDAAGEYATCVNLDQYTSTMCPGSRVGNKYNKSFDQVPDFYFVENTNPSSLLNDAVLSSEYIDRFLSSGGRKPGARKVVTAETKTEAEK